MEILFTANENDLKQLFDVLDEEGIQESCSSQVYYRGMDYFHNGYIKSAEYNSDRTLLTAKVSGNEVYTVEVLLKDKKVEAECTCFHGAVCKHIVATMLHAIHEDIDIQQPTNPVDIIQYLNNQPKEKLVDLLMKYASDDFFTMISNKQSGSSDAQKKFNKAKKDLNAIFSDVLYNDPYAFEELLMKVIKSLSGLETKIPNKVGELIIDIIGKIEKATDEGYLYDDYGDYNFEPSEQFYEFVARIASAMDFNEKKEFIKQLEDAIRDSSYSTFNGAYEWLGKFFNDNELPQLKTVLVYEYQDLAGSVVESYYNRVSLLLSDNEKENVLTVMASMNDSRAVELAELLNHMGKRKKSILMLRKLISKGPVETVDERLCILYLDQMKEEKLELRDAVIQCMNQCPKESMLRKAIELVPPETTLCEEILEKRSPGELLNYLESMERAMDALSLIKRAKNIWPERVFIFYKKNKEKVPHEAAKYFSQLINENLQNTGDYYYHTIADALKHLKQIDKNSAHEFIQHLHQNYQRRRNLMALINNI